MSMQENKRNIDDFLRDELGSYAETPPPAVWETLEKRLDASRPDKGLPFRRWWWIIPALFFVAGVVFLAANNAKTHTAKTEEPVSSTVAERPETVQPVPAHNFPDAKPDTSSPVKTNNAIQKKEKDTQHQNGVPAGVASSVLRHVTGSDTATGKAPDHQQNATPNNKPYKPVTHHTAVAIAPPATPSSVPVAATGKKHHPSHIKIAHTANITPDSSGLPHDTVNKAAADKLTGVAGNSKLPGGSGRRAKSKAVRSTSVVSQRAQSATLGSKKVHGKNIAVRAVTDENKDTGIAMTAAVGSKPPVKIIAAKETKKKPLVVKPAKKQGEAPATAAAADKRKKKKAEEAFAVGVNDTSSTAAVPNGGKSPAKVSPAKEGKKKAIVVKPAKETAKPPVSIASAKETAKKNKAVKPATVAKPYAARTTITKSGSTNVAAKKEGKQRKATVAASGQTKVISAKATARNTATVASSPQKTVPVTDNKTASRSSEVNNKTLLPLDTTESDTDGTMDTDTTGGEMDPYASLHPPREKTALHLEAGIKAAYSTGFTQFSLNKITAMPYVQLNISKRLSVVMHLGFSYGQMAKTDLSDWQSYYKVTSSFFSHTTSIDSVTQDTVFHYTYRQGRDSFATKYAVAKTVWETELPVLLKYRLGGGLSVFGGPVFTFGKIVQIAETKSSTFSSQITDTLSSHNIYTQSFFENRNRPASALPDSVYATNAQPYQNPSSTPLRIGYMLGFSYDAGKRLVLDLSVQQMLSGASYIPNPDIRKTYTSPYVRFSVGFKIFK
ncbi:hypothetical protein ACTHGU_06570 [Chitinophagaceae bacterium MMS25-I14]